MMLPHLAKRQWLTLVVFSIGNFCNAICVSLQAPFYPKEAESKGATATEYGLVFGIFELMVFLSSPIYGRYLNKIGPKVLYNGGIFTVGTCVILFGLLDKISDHHAFIALSFTIRIIEGMGCAALVTASFAIIAKEFPDNVATTFASLETCFGLGMIVGPTVGGALYELAGYTTPFAVMGSCLLLSAIMTLFVLPEHSDSTPDTRTGSLLQVLRIPDVMLAASSVIATSISIVFLQAILEPHLRKFNLTPVILGLMFVINGGIYAFTAPCWGMLCDKVVKPKIVIAIGCLFIIIGFCLIGPVPFIDTSTEMPLIIIGLVAHGFGIAAQLVASFSDAMKTSIARGLPNNIETYGLISGLWASTFALGAFIGPSLAGVLYDAIGFRQATLLVIVLNAIVCIIVAIFLICGRRRRPYRQLRKATTVVYEETIYEETTAAKLPSETTALLGNGHTTPLPLDRSTEKHLA